MITVSLLMTTFCLLFEGFAGFQETTIDSSAHAWLSSVRVTRSSYYNASVFSSAEVVFVAFLAEKGDETAVASVRAISLRSSGHSDGGSYSPRLE